MLGDHVVRGDVLCGDGEDHVDPKARGGRGDRRVRGDDGDDEPCVVCRKCYSS